MFDGYALLHKTRVQDGRVFTMHKFLKSEAFNYNRCPLSPPLSRYPLSSVSC